jgi:hypothetical protein
VIILPQSPNKMRFKRDKHSREHRERVAEENRRKARVAHLMASYEAARGPRPPITLPRISIQQQDAE